MNVSVSDHTTPHHTYRPNFFVSNHFSVPPIRRNWVALQIENCGLSGRNLTSAAPLRHRSGSNLCFVIWVVGICLMWGAPCCVTRSPIFCLLIPTYLMISTSVLNFDILKMSITYSDVQCTYVRAVWVPTKWNKWIINILSGPQGSVGRSVLYVT